jgi:hypothetical protein
MNRAIECLLYICCLAAPAEAQQVASVDLTQPSAPLKSVPMQPPSGCQKLTAGGIADGVVTHPNHEPRDITVEIVNITDDALAIGADVQAEVRLRNSGKYAIQIPWSTDPSKVNVGPSPFQVRWEEGSFAVVLDRTERLKSMTEHLFGSSLVKGSQVDILPGEWISAKVRFQLDLEYPLPGRSIKKGEHQLRVEWEQAAHAKDVKDCAVFSGFFAYRNYYDQQNPGVVIRVK